MNGRLANCTKGLVFSGALGLLISTPSLLTAQRSTNTASSTTSAVSASAPKTGTAEKTGTTDDPRETLKGAVQRELDALYSGAGLEKSDAVPGTKDASASEKMQTSPETSVFKVNSPRTLTNIKPAARVTSKNSRVQPRSSADPSSRAIPSNLPLRQRLRFPASVRRSTDPRNAFRVTERFPILSLRKIFGLRSKRTTSRVKTATAKRNFSSKPANVVAHAKKQSTGKQSTGKQSTGKKVQQTAGSAPATKVASQPSQKSDTLKQLEKLYARNGLTMPPMKLSDLPKSTNIARSSANGHHDLRKRTGGVIAQKQSPQKSPSLLKRLFPFGRNSRKTAAVHSPKPNRNATAGRAQLNGPATTKTANKNTPRLFPDFLPNSSLNRSSDQPVKSTATPKAVDVVDAKSESPFETGSKLAADAAENTPFTGLELSSDSQSKPSETKAKLRQIPDTDSVADNSNTADADSDELELKITPLASQEEQLAIESEHAEKFKRIAERTQTTGLKGFCSVAIRDERKLVDAQPEFSSVFQSKTFHFSSAEAKSKFDAAPEQYAPVLGGNDVIQSAAEGTPVAGKLDHAVWFKDRLYLFSTSETKESFIAEPTRFAISKSDQPIESSDLSNGETDSEESTSPAGDFPNPFASPEK